MPESKGWDRFQELYLMEKHRIESFRHWPFDQNSRCNLTKMAEAGFYWTGNERENDTATCFVCGKTLDGWEASDDPWKEHAKHAPQCLFVKYNKNENDITVDEFLNIFSEVMQNHITKRVEETKKKVESMARKELNLFLEKK